MMKGNGRGNNVLLPAPGRIWRVTGGDRGPPRASLLNSRAGQARISISVPPLGVLGTCPAELSLRESLVGLRSEIGDVGRRLVG